MDQLKALVSSVEMLNFFDKRATVKKIYGNENLSVKLKRVVRLTPNMWVYCGIGAYEWDMQPKRQAE